MEKFGKNLNWALTLTGVIAIGIILCVMVELLPKSFSTADLTQEKIYTISDKTKEVLKSLEEKVNIYALYDRVEGEAETGTQGRAEIVKILDLYAGYPKVSVDYVDLNKNPKFLQTTLGTEKAKEYSAGDYIVKCGDHSVKLTKSDLYEMHKLTTEEMYQYYLITGSIPNVSSYLTGICAEKAFTGSILRATNDVPVIYYDVGFGENDIGNYEILKTYIYDCGYDMKEIDLGKVTKIPEDASSMMFFGPKKDLTDSAREMLDRWLRDGKSAMFFMDIKDISDSSKIIYEDFKYFGEIFAKYGIKIENTVVSDADEYMVTGSKDSIIRMSPIKQGALSTIGNDKTVVVANTRSIEIISSDTNPETLPILKTSDGGKRNFVSGESSNKTGTVTVAASGIYNYKLDPSRICVFGSSFTFADGILNDFGANEAEEMILSALEWMDVDSKSNVESLIPAKEYSNATFYVTEKQEKIISLVTMLIIPAAILAIGVIVFFRRRHL